MAVCLLEPQKNKTMESKQLKEIAKELRAASAMHKRQAVKIDKMLKSVKPKKGTK